MREGWCLYGRATGGLVLCAVRRTNGMVAYSARLTDPWWMRRKWVPWWSPRPRYPRCTFIVTVRDGNQTTFG